MGVGRVDGIKSHDVQPGELNQLVRKLKIRYLTHIHIASGV